MNDDRFKSSIPFLLVLASLGFIIHLSSRSSLQNNGTASITQQHSLKKKKIIIPFQNSETQKERFIETATNPEGASVSYDSSSSPKVSWILSFPDSGSTDFINFIQLSTQLTTATNYGHATQSATGRTLYKMADSIPLYEGRPNGPFLYTTHLELPSTTIPTVSYCGGYCVDCYPGKYIHTRDEFIAACASGESFDHEEGEHGPTGSGTETKTKYDTKLVERAVVLLRNPYHVIQERFLHYSRGFEKLDHRDHEWIPRWDINKEGFHEFCTNQAVKYSHEEKLHYDSGFFQATVGAPCHAEMYKYLQWVNLVFESLDYMMIPYIVVHYEDMDGDYAGVETTALQFLGLNPVVQPAPAWYGGVDRKWLNEEDKNGLKALFHLMASSATSAALNRYF